MVKATNNRISIYLAEAPVFTGRPQKLATAHYQHAYSYTINIHYTDTQYTDTQYTDTQYTYTLVCIATYTNNILEAQ